MMTFLLNSENDFDDLNKHNVCTQEEQNLDQVELKVAKNFNLLLRLSDSRQLLVKQERHNRKGKAAGEFLNEWRIQEFLQRFPELSYFRPLLPEVLHFNANDSIIVFNYLNDYRDLADFYAKENVFPVEIATSIGANLATIHRTTLARQEYQEFFSESSGDIPIDKTPNLTHGLERISPEIFGQVPADGLKFFALYQLPVAAPERVLDALQDIANNIEIHSNFCISHPAYKPSELPPEALARFQRIPLELQNKFLSLQLRSFLYGIYYNGYMRSALAQDASSTDPALHQNLENNTFLGVDLEFYDRLHKSNSGEGYFDSGWSVVRQESDGSLAVTKGSLTLHIEREKHLRLAEQSAAVGEKVAIRMPRNLVQNGFYMAVSNAGPDTPLETVRVYFNLSPEGAVTVMGSLTRQLNETTIPFTFKALYNPSDYERYDSGVLYFERSNYEAVRQVLQVIYAEERSHFRPEVPLFTKLLAPGLGLAEEPDCKFATQESFGMNRCQIVANGLLEARQKSDESPGSRINAIFEHFSLLKIDWQRAYLNANSEDIYTPLDS